MQPKSCAKASFMRVEDRGRGGIEGEAAEGVRGQVAKVGHVMFWHLGGKNPIHEARVPVNVDQLFLFRFYGPFCLRHRLP
jgi:hypothetical protein